MKVITTNKKAFHNYDIQDTYEAGIALTGDEVKSLRQGNVSLVDAFATLHAGELNLINCYIAPYSHAYSKTDQSRRTRTLLLHKKEIFKLLGEVSKKGMVLVPLKLYFNQKGYIKVEIGVGKHKKAHSKKRELKERDIRRETERELKYKD
jgi:SsrA-binding protein